MSDDARTRLLETIHRTIPLSRAMGFDIVELGPHGICVEAPLEPNVNIHGTGFAGSLYALGALTAWAMGTHLIENAQLDAELVIARAEINYRQPVTGRIRCTARPADSAAASFTRELVANGRSRLPIEVSIADGAALVAAQLHARLTQPRDSLPG